MGTRRNLQLLTLIVAVACLGCNRQEDGSEVALTAKELAEKTGGSDFLLECHDAAGQVTGTGTAFVAGHPRSRSE